MNHVLVLSPHLDDAAFSLGPLLAEFSTEAAVHVATPFTKSVEQPSGFALACQLDKGLPADVDYMELRRAEDRAWASELRLQVEHGDLAEAPHRGYADAQALFAERLATDDLSERLSEWVTELAQRHQPSLVFLPIGIGRHVDHLWVREIAENTLTASVPLVYYADVPYTRKSPDAASAELATLASLTRRHVFSPKEPSTRRALRAAEHYATQIGFQFGGIPSMEAILRGAWTPALPLFAAQAMPSFFAQKIKLEK